jgi:hypothetical protein
MKPPAVALLMQTDPAARHATGAALRDLGFAVAEFEDAAHLYAHTLRAAAAHGDVRSFVILAEPTPRMVEELELLRSGLWSTPLVLVGSQARPEVARRLRAAWLPCERPTRQGLRQAIATASELGTCDTPGVGP